LLQLEALLKKARRKPTVKPRPALLLHPNVPKPLHGLAPRVVLGEEWWDREREKVYKQAKFCCQACGVSKWDARHHQWLEAHEAYDIDYRRGRAKLREIVALCHLCHNFIHDGRLKMLVEQGELTKEFQAEVLSHGKRVLGRLKKKEPPVKCAPWLEWRMEVRGKLFGPTSKSFEAWERGEWKLWKPA
jgi:hypothetical protein